MIDLDRVETDPEIMRTLQDLGISGIIDELREARLIIDITEEFSMGIALELVKDSPDLSLIADLNSQLLDALD